MREPLTKVFKGLMYPMIQNGSGVGEGTKVYTKSTAPAVKSADRSGDKASAQVSTTPMAIEIDAFVRGISKGKKYYSLNWLPQNDQRWKIRSRTFQGIAAAMADQWGG